MKYVLICMLSFSYFSLYSQERPLLAKEGGCSGIKVPVSYHEYLSPKLHRRWQHWAWPWPKIWTHETGKQLRVRLRQEPDPLTPILKLEGPIH